MFTMTEVRITRDEDRNITAVETSTQTVDQQFLDSMFGEDSLNFFRALGGTEYVARGDDGSLEGVSTSPQGETEVRRYVVPVA